FSSRRRHTRSNRDWSSDVCSSDLGNLIFRHAFVNQSQILVLCFFFLYFQLFLQLGQFSVLKPCCLVQVIVSLGFLDLVIHIFNQIGRASCRDRVLCFVGYVPFEQS